MSISGGIFVTLSPVLKPYFTSIGVLAVSRQHLAETQSVPGSMGQDGFYFPLNLIIGLEDVLRGLALFSRFTETHVLNRIPTVFLLPRD